MLPPVYLGGAKTFGLPARPHADMKGLSGRPTVHTSIPLPYHPYDPTMGAGFMGQPCFPRGSFGCYWFQGFKQYELRANSLCPGEEKRTMHKPEV